MPTRTTSRTKTSTTTTTTTMSATVVDDGAMSPRCRTHAPRRSNSRGLGSNREASQCIASSWTANAELAHSYIIANLAPYWPPHTVFRFPRDRLEPSTTPRTNPNLSTLWQYHSSFTILVVISFNVGESRSVEKNSAGHWRVHVLCAFQRQDTPAVFGYM